MSLKTTLFDGLFLLNKYNLFSFRINIFGHGDLLVVDVDGVVVDDIVIVFCIKLKFTEYRYNPRTKTNIKNNKNISFIYILCYDNI
jgi:hypothetical protein